MSVPAKKTSPRWRQAVVWLHVLSSVVWIGEALALMTLLVLGATTDDPRVRVSATSMAHVLDTTLLAPMANAAAFTGILLAASTAWGFFRHWWVLTKFVLTLAQLYAGIFLLSGALRDSVEAARAGAPVPIGWPLIAGTALMAGVLAFQAWLSVAKPGKRTSWSPTAKPRTAPAWIFAAGIAAPLADTTAGLLLGYPLPALSLLMLATVLLTRPTRLRLSPT
ncbi:DUF2269 family protein [Amycolatopsis sp. NPDC058986]|uniref:DUF2269 family protein n=1 Tax=unclassified Amycolatopsis TaxID=2618356 RepID=UPI0036726C6F